MTPPGVGPLIAHAYGKALLPTRQLEISALGMILTTRSQLQALKMPKLTSRDKRGRAGAISRRTKVLTQKQTRPTRLVRATPAERRPRGLRFALEMAPGARWSFRKKGFVCVDLDAFV